MGCSTGCPLCTISYAVDQLPAWLPLLAIASDTEQQLPDRLMSKNFYATVDQLPAGVVLYEPGFSKPPTKFCSDSHVHCAFLSVPKR
ncbi:hypothetical protein DUNSADRAFT_16498 [Dunaliella salina]|uniref:Encoded protein n=1 Tax=Dunaliella salina TaxID=3046 RepID=A0ABQ7G3G5_DUNSA|nr:hypothetical protein DUNSADRAFT_16498 [Dunaliella salina]|eukprot:KAF5829156.1 hypothetical protein DUNSADRAFT_16498 [Dunaliella salina]